LTIPMSSLPTSITVHAGPHDRKNCPVTFTLPESLPDEKLVLVSESGSVRRLQHRGNNDYAFMETSLSANSDGSYRIQSEATESPSSYSVDISHDDAKAIKIRVGNALLTQYVYGEVPARPYFFPL